MKSKIALVTGGAGGLGRELSLLLLEKGCSLLILDKVPAADLPPDFKKNIPGYFELDLSDTQAVTGFIERDLFRDGLRIDVLIINAFPRLFKDFKDFRASEISAFVNAAFLNQMLIVHAVVNKMIENDFGRIVVINSKSHLHGYSSGSLYCSLKSAWLTFHEALAKELSASNKNVNITTICPDSFADTHGNKLRHNDLVVKAVKKRVVAALLKKKSTVYYAVTFKTRIVLTWQLLKKLLNMR